MTSFRPQSSGPAQLAYMLSSKEGESGSMSVSSSRSRRMLKWFGLGLLLAVAIACLLLELHLEFANKKNTLDFLSFYSAGSILRHESAKKLYDVALQAKLQHQLLPESSILPFYHPAFEAWLFQPLARLSLSSAFLVWTVVNLVLLGLIFYLLRFTGYRLDQDRRLVWLVASIPAVAGVLVKGQDALLFALILFLAFFALKKRHDVGAGLLLGLGLFRFEIMLPFLFIFFLRRRWKVLAGFAVMSAAAAVATLAMIGWSGVLQYMGILLEAGRARGSAVVSTGDLAAMPSLRGAMDTLFGWAIPGGFLFPLVLVGTLLLLGWAAWEFKSISKPESREFDLQFSLAVIVALVASYHIFVYMLTPLLLVAFLILGHESLARKEGLLADHAGTILLLLVGLVPIVGTLAHFYHFTVVFIVLMGLCVWCSQECAALARRHAA